MSSASYMSRNNTAFIQGHPVCPTLCHISARKQKADPESSRSWIAVIMWRDSEQKTVAHHVFVTFHYCVVVTVSGNLNKQGGVKTNLLPANYAESLLCFQLPVTFTCTTNIIYANVWRGDIVWCHKVTELKAGPLRRNVRLFRSYVGIDGLFNFQCLFHGQEII